VKSYFNELLSKWEKSQYRAAKIQQAELKLDTFIADHTFQVTQYDLAAGA